MAGEPSLGPGSGSVELQQELQALGPWYHRITVEGIETPAKTTGNIKAKFGLIEKYLPSDLNGAKVLDLGCNAGGISIEFAKRGANCLGIEAAPLFFNQALWLRRRLGMEDRLRFINASAYAVASLKEKFDIVLCLGIVYHLRHPQLALDACREVCSNLMFVNAPVLRTDASVMESRFDRNPPVRKFIPHDDEARYDWWYPSKPALEAMLIVAGFENVEMIQSAERPFVSSAEGWDNSSAFPTGTVLYCAHAGAPKDATVSRLMVDMTRPQT